MDTSYFRCFQRLFQRPLSSSHAKENVKLFKFEPVFYLKDDGVESGVDVSSVEHMGGKKEALKVAPVKNTLQYAS